MKIVAYFVALLATLIPESSDGARILGIFPFPAGSHYILSNKLMTTLAEAGHDVTVVSPFPAKNIPKNASWNDIVITGLAEEHHRQIKGLFTDSEKGLIEKLVNYQQAVLHWVNGTLFDPNVRALLTPDTKFDLVIMEQFLNDAHKYFAHHFQCPLVLLSSTGLNSWVAGRLRNPLPPTDVPHFSMSNFNLQNYLDRVFNLIYYISDNLFDYFYTVPLQNGLLQYAFPGAPSISELDKRISLILLNSHESLLPPVPLVPNMVQIGGYHIDPPKALPKDLQKFLDDAKDGVIYFSMGSNLKSKDMSDDKKQILLNVFKKLKQKVLWKFEDESISNLPDNVLVKSWMPQQDILAHRNVKLFITHGGLLSTTETIYHGVPVLAIPVFADQFGNAAKAVRQGYGLQLSYNDKDFSEKTLYDRITELVTNPKYKQKVKEISRIYHDRILTPKENLVYWINYVLRYKGAEHLKVEGMKLPLYQYLMLDIIVPVLVIWHVLIFIIVRLLKQIYRLLVNSNKKSNKEKTH